MASHRARCSVSTCVPGSGELNREDRFAMSTKGTKHVRITFLILVLACTWSWLAAAQTGDASDVIAPARSGLDAVPLPVVTGLEPAVREHLQASRDEFAAAVSTRSSGGALSAAYGALARVFHAYALFDSAEPAYRNAIRVSGGDATWRYLLGYLYQQTGRFTEAAEQFEAAIRLQPGWRASAVRLGDVYLQLNRLTDARAQFESVIGTFPAVARNGLGEVALREGHYAEAIDHFRAVLDRVPTATSVHYPLAMAYRGAGRLDEARAHLERRGSGSVRIADPLVDDLQELVRGERLLVIQGKRRFDAGRFDAAADAFRRALAASPGSIAAQANLGVTLSQLGRFDEAIPYLQRAFERAPDDTTTRGVLVRALLRRGRYDEAIAVLRRVVSLDPDAEEPVIGLALILSDRTRFGDAIAVLDEAERRSPGRPAIATMLARLLASAPERSVRNGPRALDLAMHAYDSRGSAVDAESVALALAELARCGEARDWIQRAVSIADAGEDRDELTRLKAELPDYAKDACRRP